MIKSPNVGEVVRAAFLRDLADGKAIGVSPGRLSITGPGGGTVVTGFPSIKPVWAVEDFDTYTINGIDVWVGYVVDIIGKEGSSPSPTEETEYYKQSTTIDESEAKFLVYSILGEVRQDDKFYVWLSPHTNTWEVLGGGGGGDCTCDEVMELRIDGAATGGSISLTFTINGTTGSAASIAYNANASAIQSAIIAANSAELSTSNFLVLDGPLPNVSTLLKFFGSLAGIFIQLPTMTHTLTGTGVAPKIGHFTSPL